MESCRSRAQGILFRNRIFQHRARRTGRGGRRADRLATCGRGGLAPIGVPPVPAGAADGAAGGTEAAVSVASVQAKSNAMSCLILYQYKSVKYTGQPAPNALLLHRSYLCVHDSLRRHLAGQHSRPLDTCRSIAADAAAQFRRWARGQEAPNRPSLAGMRISSRGRRRRASRSGATSGTR
jgi:hypothetical protein